MFLRTGAFFSSILSEFLKNLVALHGEKIYVKDPITGENVLDRHGHLIVDHDLYSHDGLTPDGIAEAFIEFAKKEGLSFFQ